MAPPYRDLRLDRSAILDFNCSLYDSSRGILQDFSSVVLAAATRIDIDSDSDIDIDIEIDIDIDIDIDTDTLYCSFYNLLPHSRNNEYYTCAWILHIGKP